MYIRTVCSGCTMTHCCLYQPVSTTYVLPRVNPGNGLCVFCVGPLCGPPLRWWVLYGVLPSVWVPCGWGSPPVVSAFHVASTRVMSSARAHAPA